MPPSGENAVPVRADRPGVRLHDVEETRLVEARALARWPHGELMARAGQRVARWVAALAPHARRVHVLAGPGGNGGDGLHAAAQLARHGRMVTVSLCAEAAGLRSDAAQGLEQAREAGARIETKVELAGTELVIDALLGIGARGAPRGAVAAALRELARHGGRTLAIDVPSGLDPRLGTPTTDHPVRAQATLSLLTLRPGLLFDAARPWCGEVWLDRIGVEDQAPGMHALRLTGSDDHPGRWLPRPGLSHKGRFGDVLVVGGGPGMAGALSMAAMAAQGFGAGRTFVVPLDDQAGLSHPLHPEWIWRRPDDPWLAEALGRSTVVCGCGGGEAVAEHLPDILARAKRLVLDADALNALARDGALAQAARDRTRAGRSTVITPHPLEAARLLGMSVEQVQHDRLAVARELARTFGATVTLKGACTVVASNAPGGDIDGEAGLAALNASGGPALATAGTGDVLAGAIAGLWSQAAGLYDPLVKAPGTQEPLPHRVACAAVWVHGRAAAGLPAHLPVLSARLVDAMRAVPT